MMIKNIKKVIKKIEIIKTIEKKENTKKIMIVNIIKKKVNIRLKNKYL